MKIVNEDVREFAGACALRSLPTRGTALQDRLVFPGGQEALHGGRDGSKRARAIRQNL
jgi:hypothetical protein